jgi:hypothetical protein
MVSVISFGTLMKKKLLFSRDSCGGGARWLLFNLHDNFLCLRVLSVVLAAVAVLGIRVKSGL